MHAATGAPLLASGMGACCRAAWTGLVPMANINPCSHTASETLLPRLVQCCSDTPTAPAERPSSLATLASLSPTFAQHPVMLVPTTNAGHEVIALRQRLAGLWSTASRAPQTLQRAAPDPHHSSDTASQSGYGLVCLGSTVNPSSLHRAGIPHAPKRPSTCDSADSAWSVQSASMSLANVE